MRRRAFPCWTGFDGCAASIALLEGAASLKALRGAFWRGRARRAGAAAGAFRRGEQHGESDDEDETQASLARVAARRVRVWSAGPLRRLIFMRL